VRILVLTFYYPPDLSAGSFRVASVVKALQSQQPAHQIEIITTQPNRYGSFFADAPRNENIDGLRISRIPVQKHKSGMLDQSVTFLKFARTALKEVKGKQYDVVFATSSRLMTAALGAVVAARTHAKLYLDIRDIFADTIREIAPRAVAFLSSPFFSWIERRTVSKAETVALVSPGFETYFRARYPAKRLVFFTNGVDDEFLTAAFALGGRHRKVRNSGITILYAGNIGEGQGLDVILPELALRLGSKAAFRVIGDGGRRASLQAALNASNVRNVELVSPLKRDALVRAYRDADVLFLHLNDYLALQKVLPSKIFEYAATGKPILAGVSGYAAEFLRAEVGNAEVFEPCNVDAALQALQRLDLGHTPREEFVAKYRRSGISQRMAADIASAPDRAEK